ncbi:uncharacterized protein ACWYII_041070 isoform 1-T2 [Salvelinus alpinus]
MATIPMGHHLLDSSQTSQVSLQVPLPGSLVLLDPPVLPKDMLVLLATVPALGTGSTVTTADSSTLQGPVLLEELGMDSGWGLEESSVICLGAKGFGGSKRRYMLKMARKPLAAFHDARRTPSDVIRDLGQSIGGGLY